MKEHHVDDRQTAQGIEQGTATGKIGFPEQILHDKPSGCILL
jgi:hypothetical protein